MSNNHHNNRPQRPKTDSDLDLLRAAARGHSNVDIYHKTYLSRGTITRLFESRAGKVRTRCPMHLTMRGAAEAIGLEWKLVKRKPNGKG